MDDGEGRGRKRPGPPPPHPSGFFGGVAGSTEHKRTHAHTLHHANTHIAGDSACFFTLLYLHLSSCCCKGVFVCVRACVCPFVVYVSADAVFWPCI
jgi:hypothetical protein